MEYFLAPYIHLCRTNDYFILLDLQKDKYFALDKVHQEAFDALMTDRQGGATIGRELLNVGASMRRTAELLEELVAQGILTTHAKEGRPVVAVEVPTPTRSLAYSYFEQQPNITAADVLRFFASCSAAYIALKTRSLLHLVNAISAERVVSERNTDAAVAQHLVAVFQGLHPYLLAGRYSCMFDSYALLRFLARSRVYPNWIFGVRTLPFGAHCWLQQEDVILNDVPESVSSFTPIMCV